MGCLGVISSTAFSVVLLSVLEESDGAKWVDASLRAKETFLKRRRLNAFDQRSFDDSNMTVDELLQLTKGKTHVDVEVPSHKGNSRTVTH